MDRPSVKEMDVAAREISAALLDQRLLPFIEKQLPGVAKQYWGQSAGLADMRKIFKLDEPAVNRYLGGRGRGGRFDKHVDAGESGWITLVVLLSQPSSFTGGGTKFWEQTSGDFNKTLAAAQGTGLIFNGEIYHAAKPITAGSRYVYVATLKLKRAR